MLGDDAMISSTRPVGGHKIRVTGGQQTGTFSIKNVKTGGGYEGRMFYIAVCT